MLRTTCCEICGDPLPTRGRLDRCYCRTSRRPNQICSGVSGSALAEITKTGRMIAAG
jgi:hypothetical protein